MTLGSSTSLASVPPLYSAGLGQVSLKVGSAHLDPLYCPVPGSQESSWAQCRAQGKGGILCGPGCLPDASWAIGLGCSSLGLQAPQQEAKGPFCPSPWWALSLKAFWGVLTDLVMLPHSWNPIGQSPGASPGLEGTGQSFPHRPSVAHSLGLGLPHIPVAPPHV